jgi:phosphonopyruvate decarboxylase
VIAGRAVAGLLDRHGFDFFTGVPCSLVEDVIAALEGRAGGARYVPAVREDVAVGIAAGAWLAGRMPCVLMQNSGLGTSLNALASLSLMYGFPALLLVTWRGFEGKDAPEHILTGAITPQLLHLLGIPHRVLSEAAAADDIAWAMKEMNSRLQPVALIVPPKVVETGAHDRREGSSCEAPRSRPTEAWPGHAAGRARRGNDADGLFSPIVSRLGAIAAARKALGGQPIVHANGYICRESFSVGDQPQNFYMIGSMGLASSIALGLSLARPDRAAVVFDGDGNLLMSLGILAMIGGLAPRRLVHVVFDNEVYGSTGNQASPSRGVRLDRLAAAAGYRTSVAATEPAAIEAAVRAALAAEGPHFVLVKTTAEEADVPRIPYTPAEIRDRFRASVQAP